MIFITNKRLLAELMTPATWLAGESVRLPIIALEGGELVLNIRHLLSYHLREVLVGWVLID